LNYLKIKYSKQIYAKQIHTYYEQKHVELPLNAKD
jgi:hypothetical protein